MPNDFSRDETEFGAFEDPMAPLVDLVMVGGVASRFVPQEASAAELAAAMRGAFCEAAGISDRTGFGGFFDKLAKPFIKKPKAQVHAQINAQLHAQGASAAQLALMRQAQGRLHIKAKDVGKGILQSAKMGAAVASFVVPGGAIAGTAALGGLVAADKLVAAGQKGLKAAHTVVDNTKKLAAAGNIDAQRGLQAIGMAAHLRASAQIPHGVPSPVNAAGQLAHAQFLASRNTVVLPHPAAPVAARPAPPPPPLPRPLVVPPVRLPFAAPQRAVPQHVVASGLVAAPLVMAAAARHTAVPAPKALPPEQHDWLVHDSGQVQRVVRGQAVSAAGGYYVGPGGVRRLGGRA